MKNKYLFGPVPSRRLGMSLGVDMVPHKTCTLDCVYCECGPTTELTAERKELVPTAEVIRELDTYLSTAPALDYITFSGNGEPTLHSRLGEIVDFVKNNYPKYKMCLITNSTLLGEADVVEQIKNIDLIIPSFDASLQNDYNKINRPLEGQNINQFVDSLVNFSQGTKAVIWLEIFIIPNGNDSPESIQAFRDAVIRIKPDKIQLNTLDRPGTENCVQSPTQESIDIFVNALEDIAPLEVIGKFKYTSNSVFDNTTIEELTPRVVEMISRRPCTAEDIACSLSLPDEKVNQIFDNLVSLSLVEVEVVERGRFLRLKAS